MERQYRDDDELLRQKLTSSPDPQQTLQTLWTLAAINGITENSLRSLLEHAEASVRSWAIRLLCERDSLSADSFQALVHAAATENDPLVISLLAAAARRLPSEPGLHVCRTIAGRTEFSQDPRIPLQIWWALERIAIPAAEQIVGQFTDATAWETPVIREQIVGRLMRRFAADGSPQGFSAAAQLLATAPDVAQRQHLLHEMDSGLKMIGQQRSARLPLPENSLAVRQIDIPPAVSPPSTVPPELAVVLQEIESDSTTAPLLIRLALRMRLSLHMLPGILHQQPTAQQADQRKSDPQVKRIRADAVFGGYPATQKGHRTHGDIAGRLVDAHRQAPILLPHQINFHHHRTAPGQSLVNAQ